MHDPRTLILQKYNYSGMRTPPSKLDTVYSLLIKPFLTHFMFDSLMAVIISLQWSVVRWLHVVSKRSVGWSMELLFVYLKHALLKVYICNI